MQTYAVFSQQTVTLLVALVVCLLSQISAQSMPRQQGLVAPFSDQPDDPEIYGWLCPRVMCQQLPRDCMAAEYIVFKYSYKMNGKNVDVRCESCVYCMDPPRRRRRQATPAQQTPCARVSCPLVPFGCQRVRMTDLLVRDVWCRRCPACFDNTLVKKANQ